MKLKNLEKEKCYQLWRLAFDDTGDTLKIEKEKLSKSDLKFLKETYNLKYWIEYTDTGDFYVFKNKNCY